MKLLFIGDVVGEAGKRAIAEMLPQVKATHRPHITIVNGENIADGRGITERDYKFLLQHGADVITLGNHAFDHSNIYRFIQDAKCLVRPINFLKSKEGKGVHIIQVNDEHLAVINVLTSVFMDDCLDPFESIVQSLKDLPSHVKHIFVDIHGETTSEKLAMAYYLDGKVSAIIGTHTHVQTNDARILPLGTAYLTDVGMTGSLNSVIGFEPQDSIQRFLTKSPVKLRVAEGNPLVMGAVLIDTDRETGRAQSIKIINTNER